MIIRSQDKTMIVNFNGSSNIYTQGNEIWANTYHGIAKLGTYSTEEKAIKVLDMIQDKYLSSIELVGGYDVVSDCYVQPNYWVLPKVFQMPQDSEV